MSIRKTRSVWLTTLCILAIVGGSTYGGINQLASADEKNKEDGTLQELEESEKDAMVREAVEKAIIEANAKSDTADDPTE